MKVKCSKCKIEKETTEFKKDKSKKLGRSSQCKECQKPYAKKYQLENLDKWSGYNKKWRENNLEKSKEIVDLYYQNNKEKHKQNMKEWYAANPDYNKEYWQREKVKLNDKEYRKERRKNPKIRVTENVRTRIYNSIKNKNDASIQHLGCSIQDYFVYLENQFDEHMNWENYGTYWEIDHTIPLSKGGSFHYTNTTPMSVTENRKKGNRY
jgi:hypothetical protein